jgi:hypothetical protein
MYVRALAVFAEHRLLLQAASLCLAACFLLQCTTRQESLQKSLRTMGGMIRATKVASCCLAVLCIFSTVQSAQASCGTIPVCNNAADIAATASKSCINNAAGSSANFNCAGTSMTLPTNAIAYTSGPTTCASPDAYVTFNVQLNAYMASGAPANLHDIGLHVSTNGVSPDKFNSACNPMSLPKGTSNCYASGANDCGDVIK